MKAIVCTKYGPPDVLQLKEVEKPTPKGRWFGLFVIGSAIVLLILAVYGYYIIVYIA